MIDQRYRSSAGYFANTTNYNPNTNLMDIFATLGRDIFFPNAVQQAPNFMTQYDFDYIRRQTDIRNSISGQYKQFNPLAISMTTNMLSGMGMKNPSSLFMDSSGSPTSMGRIVSDSFDTLFGLQSSAYSSQGAYQNIIRDASRGIMFGGQNGLGIGQSRGIMNQLMTATYSDPALTRQRGMFSGADMMESYRLAKDFGALNGVQASGLAGRTQDFSRIVQQGMTTFGTGSQEEALRSIIEITGGNVNMNDTSRLEQTLTNVKGLARSANLSIEVLKQVLERGQEVAQQLGMTGLTGTNVTTSTMNTLRNVSGLTGNTVGPGVNMNDRGAVIAATDMMKQFMSNQDNMRDAGVLGAMEKMGMDTSGLMNRLQSGNLSTAERTQFRTDLISRAQSELGLDKVGAREYVNRLLVDERRAGAEKMSAEISGETQMINLGKRVLGSVISSSGSDTVRAAAQKAIDGKDLTDEERKMLQPFIASVVKSTGMGQGKTPEQLQAFTETLTNAMFNQDELTKAAERDRTTQKLTQIRERFGERTRQSGSALDRFLSTVGSGGGMEDILTSLLPQTADGFDLRNLSPDQMAKLSNNATDMIRTFGLSSKGMDIQKAAANILGSGGFGADGAFALLGADTSNLGSVGADFDAVKSRLSKQLKSGSLITLSDVLGGKELTPENIQQGLATLKKLSPKSFEKAKKDIALAKSQGFERSDLKRLYIGDMSAEEMNALEEVKSLGKELLEDPSAGFTSADQLMRLAEDSGDPELERRARILTEKNLDDYINDKAQTVQNTLKEASTFARKDAKTRRANLKMGMMRDNDRIITIAKRKSGKGVDLSGLDLNKIQLRAGFMGAAGAVAEQLGDSLESEDQVANIMAAIREKGMDLNKFNIENLHRFKRPDDISDDARSFAEGMSVQDRVKLLSKNTSDTKELRTFLEGTGADMSRLKDDEAIKGVAFLAQQNINKELMAGSGLEQKMGKMLGGADGLPESLRVLMSEFAERVFRVRLEQ